MKKQCTKLVIHKYKVIDQDGLYTFKYEWYNPDGSILFREIRKIQPNDLGEPDVTNLSHDDLINHKIDCCMIIDKETFIVEEVQH